MNKRVIISLCVQREKVKVNASQTLLAALSLALALIFCYTLVVFVASAFHRPLVRLIQMLLEGFEYVNQCRLAEFDISFDFNKL